jgi:hypothetical protein
MQRTRRRLVGTIIRGRYDRASGELRDHLHHDN